MPIHWEVDGPVATVTIEGDTAVNACDYVMFEELADRLMNDLDNDPEIKVGIIRGAGRKAFSVGADLKMADSVQKSGEDQEVYGPHPIYYSQWPPLMSRRIRTPLIGVVHGWCLGAGCITVALNCSIRLAGDSARFGYTELKMAMAGGSAMARSARQMHYTTHMLMSTLGDDIDAQTALRAGFVNEVLPDDELMGRALALAARIASMHMRVSLPRNSVISTSDPNKPNSSANTANTKSVCASGR